MPFVVCRITSCCVIVSYHRASCSQRPMLNAPVNGTRSVSQKGKKADMPWYLGIAVLFDCWVSMLWWLGANNRPAVQGDVHGTGIDERDSHQHQKTSEKLIQHKVEELGRPLPSPPRIGLNQLVVAACCLCQKRRRDGGWIVTRVEGTYARKGQKSPTLKRRNASTAARMLEAECWWWWCFVRFVVGAVVVGAVKWETEWGCVHASKRLLVFVADVLKKEGRSAHCVEISANLWYHTYVYTYY